MFGEAIRNPTRLLWDLGHGKVNRAALANIQDMAVTAGEVYGLYKLAELAGYEVDFNPTSADFLKMRKGDEVWDPTAGLAPRLRDMARVGVAFMDPEYAKEHNFDLQTAVGKAGTRTISPTFRTPIEAWWTERQKDEGVKDSKIRSFFTGMKIDPEDQQGWIAFTPLVYQTFRQTLEAEDLPAALSATGREWLGQSVSRYPKPKGE
jgi:hypothetical protein